MGAGTLGAGARREGSRPPSSFLRLLLVWATAFSAAEWHGGAFVSAERDFAAWLARGVLHLPAQTISKGKLTVRLAEFECRGTAVDRVHATRITPSHSSAGLPALHGVSFTVAGLRVVSCAGNYSAKFGASTVASGAFNFSVHDADLTVGVLFNGTSESMPLIFPKDLCGAALHIAGLHFWGSLSSILNGLVPTLENEIALLAEGQLCTKFLDPLLAGLNPLLAGLNVLPVTPPASPAVVPAAAENRKRGSGKNNTKHFPPRLVNWNADVPVLGPVLGHGGSFGAKSFNEFIDHFTLGGNLTLSIPSALERAIGLGGLTFPFNVSNGLFSGALSGFGIGGVKVTGMDHATGIDVASRDDVTGRHRGVVLDGNASASGWTTTLSDLRVNLIIDPTSDISNPDPLNVSGIEIVTGLRNVLGRISVLIAADYERMDALTLDGLVDVFHGSGQDVLATVGAICEGVYGINFTDAVFAAEIGQVSISAAGSGVGTGPGGVLLDEIAQTITTGLVAFLDVEEFRTRLLTNVANFVLPLLRPDLNAYVTRLLRNATQEARSKNVGDGSAQEPRPDLKDVNPDVIREKVGIVVGIAVGAMIAYVGLLRCLERSCCPGGRRGAVVAGGGRGGTLTSPLMAAAAEELGNACDDDGGGRVLGDAADPGTVVSLASIYAGTWKRIGVPVLHIACAAIGAWSLSVPVCDVRVRVTGGLVDANKVVLDDSLLVYTFPQMVSDFWNSGSWMIALLLVAGTAVLPQLKGVFSVVLWAMPMNHRHRGYALTFLDVVGRFVLVCQVFIMLVVATLRARISFPGLVSDVVAEPIHSIAGATTGLLGMMIVSQFTVYLHDFAPRVAAVRKPKPASSDFRNEENFARNLRRVPTSMIVVLLLTSAVTTFVSVTTEILEFQIEGIAGDAEATAASKTPSVKRISLVGLPAMVYADTDQKGVAIFASLAMVLFTIAAPLACIVVWSLQWWWALRHRRHPARDKEAPAWIRVVAYGATYAYSWCALDVVWFAIGSSALEMNLVTQWIVQKQPGIGEACLTLEEWTDGKTECVKVVGRFTEGSWFLLGAAVSTAAMFGLTCKVFGVRL